MREHPTFNRQLIKRSHLQDKIHWVSIEEIGVR